MKRRLVCLLLCCALLAGCGASSAESQPLPVVTICTDAETNHAFGQALQALAREYSSEYEFDFITLPGDDNLTREDEALQGQLARLRTQIMSGRGPDLFLCSGGGNALFTDPQKMMRAGVFADLAPYMDDFSAGRQLNEAVLAAGRAEGVQYVLPLTFTVGALLTDAETAGAIAAQTTGCIAPADFLGAVWQMTSDDPLAMITLADMLNSLCAQPAVDYDSKTAALDEEGRALLALAAQVESACEAAGVQGELAVTAQRPFVLIAAGGRGTGDMGAHTRHVLALGRTPALVPVPNGSGGVTASVGVYGGIRANSPHAALAAQILEQLLGQAAFAPASGASFFFPLDSALCPTLARQAAEAQAAFFSSGTSLPDTSPLADQWAAAADAVNAAHFAAPAARSLWQAAAEVSTGRATVDEAAAAFAADYRFYFDE